MVGILLGGLILGWGGPLAAGLWVKQEIERRLTMDIQGVFWPGFFRPSFELKKANFIWQDKVKVLSGNLKIDYDPISLLNHRRIRVRMEGRDLSAVLLGKWAETQGVQDLKFHDFFADFEIGEKGLEEVNALKAHSPLLNLDFTPHLEGAGANR